ncbi:hypothetical protein PGT21_016111 [Puccinia graminis f. sp. tritici]|uniref:Uncharacterized protein n=1 Tax=Puccinia graminis f. sp. tritici TaxID=56615 RepID=A0A5B0PAH7_PUCGR|nr:hypothetical protein PGT21_016111 [Puccinia graminis f. sp. tritici]
MPVSTAMLGLMGPQGRYNKPPQPPPTHTDIATSMAVPLDHKQPTSHAPLKKAALLAKPSLPYHNPTQPFSSRFQSPTMSTLRAPNHPTIISGIFEPTADSVPESQRGNQYGVLTTPSFFQCAGYLEQEPTDFEVNLITNTALNNVLQVGELCMISGRLIVLNDGSTPTLTYNHDTIVQIPRQGTASSKTTNRTAAVRLGHVVERVELMVSDGKTGTQLDVIVAHNNCDAIARIHRRFLVKYIIPGSKNLIKTHSLFQASRELQLLSHLVDFELERNMAVFAMYQVHSVSLTSGHQTNRSSARALSSSSGSARNGRKFVKFGSQPAHPAGEPLPHRVDEGEPSGSSSSNLNKGKGRATAEVDLDGTTSEEETPLQAQSSSPSAAPVTSKKGRPRMNILKEAAKRMKRA